MLKKGKQRRNMMKIKRIKKGVDVHPFTLQISCNYFVPLSENEPLILGVSNPLSEPANVAEVAEL